VLSLDSTTDLIRPSHLESVDRTARSLFGLELGQVDLWGACLDLPMEAVFDLERSLSSDESQRAARFKFSIDRQRFIAGRGLLRSITGAYLECDPSAVPIAYGQFGKPHLAMRPGPKSIFFNLSHSGALAVFAFGRGRELGVDVEQVDCKIDFHQVSNQFFTSQEVADIMAQPRHGQHLRFFEFWTRKEALLKALGRGLSMDLRDLDVSAIGAAAGHAHPQWLADPKTRWSVRQFVPLPGYIGALATSGGEVRVVHRDVRWTRAQSGAFVWVQTRTPMEV